jgi:hypothetical protein
MFGFNRRQPVELVMQHPIAEPAYHQARAELDAIDLALWEQSCLHPGDRDLDRIDDLLDERLAVLRAMVPVVPGLSS